MIETAQKLDDISSIDTATTPHLRASRGEASGAATAVPATGIEVAGLRETVDRVSERVEDIDGRLTDLEERSGGPSAVPQQDNAVSTAHRVPPAPREVEAFPGALPAPPDHAAVTPPDDGGSLTHASAGATAFVVVPLLGADAFLKALSQAAALPMETQRDDTEEMGDRRSRSRTARRAPHRP